MRYPHIHICQHALCLLLILAAAANYARPQDKAARVQPILRLEKPKYVLGEAIRFWVGVEPKNSPAVPQEFRKPCSLTITKPDGTIEKQSVGWPLDGPMDRGWHGGWGFGKDEVIAGTYILVLDCAGEKTKPLELTVERNDVLGRIKTQFHFEPSGDIRMGTSVPVTLTVQNDSQHSIRFPKRGVIGEGITVSVLRDEPAFHANFFYPWEKLSDSRISVDTYTWDVAADIPSIVLQPGERFEQRFSLEEAYSFDQPGRYEVTFGTVLAILIGEKSGLFTDLGPIRLPVVAKERFTVSDSR